MAVPPPPSLPHTKGSCRDFLVKWTPRALAAAIGGYYGLGVAYHCGLMARLDRAAIALFGHFAGYAGIGAFMPHFQWYAAWGVRITVGLAAGLLYDLVERVIRCCAARLRSI